MAQFEPVQDVLGLGRLAQQIRLNRQEAQQAPIRALQQELLQGKVEQQRGTLADIARQRQNQADLQTAIQQNPEMDVDRVSLDFFKQRDPAKAQQFEQMIFGRATELSKIDPQGASAFLTQKTGQQFDFSKAHEALGLKSRELDIKEQAQRTRESELVERRGEVARKAAELKPTMQKILDTAQNQAFEAETTANEFDLLVDDFRGKGFGGGVKASVNEFLKDALGTQDEVSALRRKFRGIRASQATKNLPPGPASDKDIALALSGFPPENAPAEVIASFLTGASKMARIDQAFQSFKAEYISENKNSAGLIKAWRNNRDKIIDDALRDFRPEESPGAEQQVVLIHPVFGDVSEEDIQATMSGSNMTREQVLQRLQGNRGPR